jgi:hypothetical protein
LGIIQQNDNKYPGLFGEPVDSGGTNDSIASEGKRKGFMHRFGWIYNVKQIADFKNITVDEAWNTPTVEALNILSYLKAYDGYLKSLK